MGLARHGFSSLERFGVEAGGMSFDREDQVLDSGHENRCWVRESRAFHVTDGPLHSCRVRSPQKGGVHKVGGCSHLSSALSVLPQWEEALPLAENAMLLLVNSRFLP